jgi:hypothetical protein
MAFGRRKQREMIELEQDPNFAFYVGRLIGAAEMTSHWLVFQQGNDAKDMGRGLSRVVSWFLTEDMEEPPPPVTRAAQISPPKGMNP